MKTVFLLTHSSSIEGPSDYLESYLIRNNFEVLKLSHPLDKYKNQKTTFSINKKIEQTFSRRNIGIANLFLDLYISLRYLTSKKYNIFIGANNFDTFAAIISQQVFRKKISKIIYFASDFSEDRFSNSFLNSLYTFVEKTVLKRSDLVISNTLRAENKRIELGLQKDKSIVIPNGVYLKNPIFEAKDISKENFIFVGSVTKEHGLYDIVDALQTIKKLVLIGQGEDWDRVVALCKQKNILLEAYPNKEHEFVIEYLQKFNGIGLAPYNLDSKWTHYCSPLKVNEYIACGVPVLISNVPEIAKFIRENNLGITYNKIDSQEIAQQIENTNFSNFNLKSKSFYSNFNLDNLYKNLLIKL